MDPDPDLHPLLTRIAGREPNALTELHQLVANRLFAISLNILKSREESEDTIQEIFLKIWNKASSYNPSLGNPMSWLITIARNTSYDKYRKRVRNAEQLETAKEDLTDMASPHQPHQADDILLSSERNEKIRAALKNLVPDQREAIELAFFSGHTQQEISEQLSVPLGTIKARIRRGMQCLKPQLTQTA